MNGCDLGAVEAYALGELEGARVGQVRAHLGACAACSRELALLGEERRALASYTAPAGRPLPDFGAVLARSRAQAERPAAKTKRPAPARSWFVAFAAAALVLQMLPAGGASRFAPGDLPGLAISAWAPLANPLNSPFAPGEPPALVCRLDDVLKVDVAAAENAFRACLIVTPAQRPPAFADGGTFAD